MRLLRSFKLTPSNAFALVYLAIAVSTFGHTSWAGSFVFEGVPPGPDQLVRAIQWAIAGGLLAVAVDVGMFVTAHQLPHSFGKQRLVLLISFVVAAAVSAFTQILYVAHHSAPFALSEGISPYWAPLLSHLADARVIIMPISLPIFAILYTITRMFIEKPVAETTQQKEEPVKREIQVSAPAPVPQRPAIASPPMGKSLPAPVKAEITSKALPAKSTPVTPPSPSSRVSPPTMMMMTPPKKKVDADT